MNDEQPSEDFSEPTTPEVFPIVAIGASAGGLAALKVLLPAFPADAGLAYVVVVHLSPDRESHLAELLRPHVQMPVQQVRHTVPLAPNHVYLIPPNANLDTIDTHLRLSELEQNRRERAPIDHFFRTLADTHGPQAIGVVLTGSGSDGTLGLRRIKEQGGLTVAQDPNEAEYDGMPRSAIAAGAVDLVRPLARIPEAVRGFTSTRPRLRVPRANEDEVAGENREVLKKIFAKLQARTGRDFSLYKRSTILRRITRRMQFFKLREPLEYIARLDDDPDEVRALADDLLITVTNFFRDPEVFDYLARHVIPSLFEDKADAEPVRVWSVGCATGEEAYSLGILLLEEAARRQDRPRIQIFASDLHVGSLETAREGFYPGDIAADVSPERLGRFFQRHDGGYRVSAEVREHVVFAPHNLLADPPFSRVDLISCRNLLIYLQRDLQRQVGELFHYALRPGGRLLLGTSEALDAEDLFRVEDKRSCLLVKRNVPPPDPRLPVFPSGPPAWTTSLARGSAPSADPVPYGRLHRRMIERYGPPSVLVGPDDEVVHFSERAGRYIVHPGGTPTTSVYKIVRDELLIELRAALSAARSEKTWVRTRPVRVRFDGDAAPVILDVRPSTDAQHEGFVLLIFDEQPEPPEPPEDAWGGGSIPMRELETEKRLAEQRLQAIIEEYETSREELRASNEELQSANEELRSTLEELETSKEELQSMNEELQTVNQENRYKVDELSELSSDLQNLLAATDIATLFLDRELRILRFTPRVADLFNVRMADRGRPLSDITHHLGYDGIPEDAAKVLERLIPIEREIKDGGDRYYLTRVLPYRTSEDRIAGVVVTFVDITKRRAAETELRDAKSYAENIIGTMAEPLLVLESDLRVQSANPAFYAAFEVKPQHTEGRNVYDLGNGQWDIPELRDLLERILPQERVLEGYRVDHVFESLGRRVMLLNGRQLDHQQLILLAIHDITEQVEIAEARQRTLQRWAQMTNVDGIGILAFDGEGRLIDANPVFESLIGYRLDEMRDRGMTWRDITAPEHVEETERQVELFHRTGFLGPFEKELVHRDGHRRWMLFVGAQDEEGRRVEYCVDLPHRERPAPPSA